MPGLDAWPPDRRALLHTFRCRHVVCSEARIPAGHPYRHPANAQAERRPAIPVTQPESADQAAEIGHESVTTGGLKNFFGTVSLSLASFDITDENATCDCRQAVARETSPVLARDARQITSLDQNRT